MAEIKRLSEDEVLTIRRRMADLAIAEKDAFGQVEPLDVCKFSSAVSKHQTSGGGIYKYKTIEDVAANLFYGIAMGHSFENGNKRTALVSTLVFLDKNKTLLVDTSEDELYEFARMVAAHEFVEIKYNEMHDSEMECKAISKWFLPRLRGLQLGEKILHYKEFREILEELSCIFDSPNGNYIKIRRGKWMVKTGYPRENFDIPIGELKRIRRSLRLDEVHGMDSAAFYDFEAGVSKFVNKHRNLLRRLADI